MRPVAVTALIVLAAGGAYAQAETLLHPCESLETAGVGLGRQLDETRLFVSHAAEHVTEGAGAVGIYGHAPADAAGNVYISIYLFIEPADLTERALLFHAATSTPEQSKALYVRGYDADGQCVMSWLSWRGELTATASEFRLVAGGDTGTLTWEPGRIENPDRSGVVRLEFITGTGEKDVDFNLVVDNVRAGAAG